MKIKLSEAVKKIKIETEFIKLDSFLKLANAAVSGGQAKELPDGLVIAGTPRLAGGTADSFGDHRIAMLAAVLAGGCREPVTVLGAQCTSKSYPEFWQTLDQLKGDSL